MHILLVFCHPAQESFQHTILADLTRRLEHDGHVVRILELYADGFDPVLDLEGWRAHRRNEAHAAADLSAHVAALREADGLIFVYPTWWYGLPAMLKGWLDQVWQPGVAFAIEDGVFKTRYLQSVTRFAVITTYGSPGWFIERIVGDPARRQLVRGLALQFARGARSCWRPIYDVDNRSRADLARARERAVTRVVRHFRRYWSWRASPKLECVLPITPSNEQNWRRKAVARINGGAVLARSMAALGVREVFALHGGHLDSFLVACAGEGIRLTDTRHEATAGYAATAYARATSGIGVCVVTAGPGFTNALTAMVDAFLDATPVLFVMGSPPLREVATNPLQGGFDQVAMAAPVTKWAHRITNVERIPDLVDKAVRTALSGRPGPVFLEMPIDVMFGPIAEEDVVLPGRPELTARPAPPPEAVERILDLLAAATRPAIIVGGGALSARCSTELQAFAELTGTPVAYSGKGHGVMPADHPLNVGGAGTLAAAALGAGQPADLVIQIGARAGLFLGGRGGMIVPDTAMLVQIDIDGAEIGRLRAPDIAVTADSGEALAALNIGAKGRSWTRPEAWPTLLQQLRFAARAAFKDAPAETRPGMIHPFHAARAVAEALSPDTAIAFDGGESSSWFQMFGRSPGPGLYTGNGYLGTLGVGQGFAIGLARARPGKPVCAIMGDGAVGFHLTDFDTMARHGLPILTCVFNNAAWGMSLHGQELVFGKQNLAAVKLAPSAYHTVAEGLGCLGEQITRAEDIGPAVRRAQASGRPVLLNIMTDPDVAHPVTAQMIGRLDADDEIPIPYYENIPIRRH